MDVILALGLEQQKLFAAAYRVAFGFSLLDPGELQVRGWAARLAPKQSPQRTGLPVEGLKGTESVLPHWSQVISNRWRSPLAPFGPPKFERRASRQGLHRFG
jgi:hypothetical protein